MGKENKVSRVAPATLQHANARALHAFTIIELLLVITILGILVAVIAPDMTRSIKGNRLRTAVRSVVMAGRYARSMAVLRQATMAVTFDLGAGTVSVDRLAPPPDEQAEAAAYTDTTYAESEPDPPPESDGVAGPSVAESQTGGTRDLARKLDGVTIEYVETTDSDELFTEGQCRILYRNNGRCTPYKIRIIDEDGGAATLEVDALGSAVTKE